jgi:hypothetical protein
MKITKKYLEEAAASGSSQGPRRWLLQIEERISALEDVMNPWGDGNIATPDGKGLPAAKNSGRFGQGGARVSQKKSFKDASDRSRKKTTHALARDQAQVNKDAALREIIEEEAAAVLKEMMAEPWDITPSGTEDIGVVISQEMNKLISAYERGKLQDALTQAGYMIPMTVLGLLAASVDIGASMAGTAAVAATGVGVLVIAAAIVIAGIAATAHKLKKVIEQEEEDQMKDAIWPLIERHIPTAIDQMRARGIKGLGSPDS